MKTQITFSISVELRKKLQKKIANGKISEYISGLIEDDLNISNK